MPVNKSAKPIDTAPIQKEVNALVLAIQPQIKGLSITTPEAYAQADSWLSRIGTARKVVVDRFKSILDPLKIALDAAKKAHTEAKRLQDDIDAPLAESEYIIRQEMKAYKNREAQQIREQEEARQREKNRILQEAKRAELSATVAQTPAAKTRLENKQAALENQAAQVAAVPVPAPVQVMNSRTRTVTKIRVTDPKSALKAVLAGVIPMDVVYMDMGVVAQLRKLHGDDLIKSWPGFEIYEEIEIVRNSR